MNDHATVDLTISIKCDYCFVKFQPDVKERALSDGGVMLHFVCPACAVEYKVKAISFSGVELRKMIRALRAEGMPVSEGLLARFRGECS